MKSINYDAPDYVIFWILQFFSLLEIQAFLLEPFSQTPTIYLFILYDWKRIYVPLSVKDQVLQTYTCK
jgi:hypothetical protein